MFESIAGWVVDAIQGFTEFLPDMWLWLTTDHLELGWKPIEIFGWVGLTAVLGILIVHFIAIWN